jgi:hypothetical protein
MKKLFMIMGLLSVGFVFAKTKTKWIENTGTVKINFYGIDIEPGQKKEINIQDCDCVYIKAPGLNIAYYGNDFVNNSELDPTVRVYTNPDSFTVHDADHHYVNPYKGVCGGGF